MREVTFTDLERIDAVDASTDAMLQMDEDAFRAFYDRTARSVWLYLSRLTGDPSAADDLLQEAYYRFLRVDRPYASDAHRKNYLFRIATNLAHDRRRRHVETQMPEEGAAHERASGDEGERAAGRIDLQRALARLKPRERSLVLLAYGQGSSHHEIAESLGVKTASVKALLFRARRRLASILEGNETGRAGSHAGRTRPFGKEKDVE